MQDNTALDASDRQAAEQVAAALLAMDAILVCDAEKALDGESDRPRRIKLGCLLAASKAWHAHQRAEVERLNPDLRLPSGPVQKSAQEVRNAALVLGAVLGSDCECKGTQHELTCEAGRRIILSTIDALLWTIGDDNRFDGVLAVLKAVVADAEKVCDPSARMFGYKAAKAAIRKASGE